MQMDTIYLFVFRHMEWFFVGIILVLLLSGIAWFFIPNNIIRRLERTPLVCFRFLGLAGIILSLVALYFVLYR